jgi:hypothetical protein
MLGMLALVPQTTLLYEMVPLLLIPRTWREMLVLVGLSLVTGALALQTDPSHHLTAAIVQLWPVFLLLVYLPCLYLVLRRENSWGNSQAPLPKWRWGTAPEVDRPVTRPDTVDQRRSVDQTDEGA